MTSWKRPAFIATVTFTPPLLFSFSFWARNKPINGLSLALTTVGLVFYVSVLAKITLPYFTHPLRNLPVPLTTSFIFGDGLAFLKAPPGHEHLRLAKTVPNNGLILFCGFFHTGYNVILTTPAALKEALNDKSYDYEKPPVIRNFLRRMIGDGLVNAEGQAHKLQRKSVTPAFHGSHIKELVPLFWRKGNQLTSTISLRLNDTPVSENKGREGVIELQALAAKATLDVIGLACLGHDFNTLENNDDELAKCFATITSTENGAILRYLVCTTILGRTVTSWLLWKTDRIFNKATETLHRLSKKLVEAKKLSEAHNSGKDVDILSVLLHSSAQFTDEELKDQLLTFLAAGFETTSNAFTWACYLLSTHPEIQSRLRAEVHNIIGDSAEPGADFDVHDIDANPFLTAVCNESLRLYPTIPETGRRALRDTSILGVPIPEGTLINTAPWMINRLTSLWGPDAEEFRPERWMADGAANTGGAVNPYSFLTFLHGPRSCIGQVFARSELKCLVAAMVARFEIEMADKEEVVVPTGPMSSKPKGGLRIRVREV